LLPLTLKKNKSILKMKKAAKIRTRPTTAPIIIPRALSIPALSPPERIHLTPPQTRKIMARMTPITRSIERKLGIAVWRSLASIPQRALNGAMLGQVLIFALALAGRAKER